MPIMRKELTLSSSICLEQKITNESTVQMSGGKMTMSREWCVYMTWISYSERECMRAIAAMGIMTIRQMS